MRKPPYSTLGAMALAVAGLAGCRPATPPPAAAALPAATVRVQTIERKTRPATEDVIGTVRAKLHAVIAAKVTGRLELLRVVPGQEVAAGELLLQLDAHELQSQLDQAQALRQQADADLKRYTTLLDQKISSQSEFDTAQSRARVATAAVTEAETMLGYTKITAPFAGVITRKSADVGDLATPGKALLEMEDARALRLEADVPQAVIGNLKLDDPLPVRISDLPDALTGTISEISPTADPNSRTFLVKLDLPAAAGLRTGQFGRVVMPVGETSALRCAAAAVIRRGQMELAFVAVGDHAQLRLVKTGNRIGDEVEIVSGLEVGEKVVVSDVVSLTDGQPLTIQNEK